MTDKIELLQEQARVFRSLLEKYAGSDHDVADFLERITPLFEEVFAGKINPPYEYRFRKFFTNPDFSPLAERYGTHELSRASANFSAVLEDDVSQSWYQEFVEKFKEK